MKSIADVWKNVLDRLRGQLSETTIDTWFDEINVITMEDSAFVLHCSNTFKKSTIEARFIRHIKEALKDIFSTEVNSITTAKTQVLCIDGEDAAYMKDKRVIIVDDVISTGESLKAVEKLVRKAGGNVVARMAILAEGDAKDRDDILFLEHLPLFNADGTVKA